MKDNMIHIDKEMSGSMSVNCSSNHYPYGTSLSFSDGLCEELSVDNLAVGDIVEVRGYAFVESKSEHDSVDDDASKSITIQFTDLKVNRETADAAVQMYGNK